MTRSLLIITCGLLPHLHAQEVADDLLRFANGDQLHGQFQGIAEGPSVIWQRKDLGETANFGINNLRHLVIRGGKPAEPLKSISLVELVNGDQIPGTITALSEKELTIQTPCAGTITLERNKVTRVAPQPLGGDHHHGPFSTTHWDVVSYNPDEVQVHQAQGDFDGAFNGFEQQEEREGDAKNTSPGWQHSGAAWYWKGSQPGCALILRNLMPKRSTLRFDLAWKNQLNMAIAIHADFRVDKKAAPKPGDNQQQAEEIRRPQFIPHDSSSLPAIFGNAYVLQINSNYMVIYRSIVDAEGNQSVKRVQTASSRLQIGENSTSTFEIRSDLDNAIFSLFVNGRFVTQWSDPAIKDEKVKPVEGGSLAFMPQVSNAQMKITDVIVAEWNGMPDAARSMQVEDQDIILMTNGLDRLAGKAIALGANEMLRFKGRHGEFLVPLAEISELRMASKDLIAAAPSDELIKVRFSPMGLITGTPVSGDRKTMILRHPLAGDITIHNDAAVLFEFDDAKEIFTDWDENF